MQQRGGLRPEVLNKILLVLGFLGLFDAGLLSAEAGLRLNLSCGMNGGCATVASHPSAFWFGIPVAYFGLVGYLALTTVAALRMIQGVGKNPFLVKAGFVMAAGGALISIYLQYMALVVIGAFCPYCFASACTMLVTLGTYAVLNSKLKGVSPALVQVENGSGSWIGVGVVATVVALFVGVTALQAAAPKAPVVSIDKLKDTPLIPTTNAHTYGDSKSTITVVEFADLCCIHCQLLTPKLHQFVDQYPGKVWTVYRHFPLIKAHKQAVAAALVSEYAAEHGKFWEYALALMAPQTEPQSTDELLAPAAQAGLNVDEIRKKLQDPSDPIYDAVQKDMNAALKLGINSTPTFFIIAPNIPTKVAVSNDIFDVLSESPYKELLQKKRAAK